MTRALPALALLLGLPLSVAACLWDRDTPADEAKGLPEVVAVLTGRFERNPPLFYEMRLARVRARLQLHPEDLAAYDDAGVACDRLGRGDEAVAWMADKLQQMEKRSASDPERKEHLYRYHANVGTFLVHRWARRGADRAKLDEVKAARDEIARALVINPDAHFGREKYQLRALEWVISPPEWITWQDVPNLLGWPAAESGELVKPAEAHEAVRGLTGLVVLGNAWESVDVFHALTVALQHDTLGFRSTPDGGRNALAYFAWLRCCQLVDAGKGSLLPGAPTGETLKSALSRPRFVEYDGMLDHTFREQRKEADAWQAARLAFMTERLKQGRHPDTDRDFWNGFADRPAPGLPKISPTDAFHAYMQRRQRLALLFVVCVPALAIGSLVLLTVKLRRRRARLEKSPAEGLVSDLL